MMTTSNEHNNAPAVPLGYINAGHLHEMQSGRLPYAYLYAAPGVGVEIPVYTSNAPAVPQGWKLVQTPITEEMHVAAAKVLHRAPGLAGLPQRMLDAMLAATPAPAPAVPQGWTKAADQVPLEADGEVFIRFTDGSIGTGWATYWHGASNEFAQWTFPDPDEDRTVLEWTKNPATPAPSPAQERCHLCDCTGDIHDATGEWRDECPYCKPEQEVTQSEPIYQLQRGDGSWIDQDKASYDYNAQYGINTIRIVYTAPAPAQEAMQSFTVPDDLPGMWEHSDLTGGETDCAKPAQDVMRAHVESFAKRGGWEPGSGEGAFEFAQRTSYRAGWEDGKAEAYSPHRDKQEVGLTEAERVRCLIASGCIGTVKMTYDSGPYEITRTSINASRLIDAIIAALRAKGGK